MTTNDRVCDCPACLTFGGGHPLICGCVSATLKVSANTALIYKLRAKRCPVGHVFNDDGAAYPEIGLDPDCQEAAGVIIKLQEENARLRVEGTRRMKWILDLVNTAKVLGAQYAENWDKETGDDH